MYIEVSSFLICGIAVSFILLVRLVSGLGVL
jgi:hypothetical protein